MISRDLLTWSYRFSEESHRFSTCACLTNLKSYYNLTFSLNLQLPRSLYLKACKFLTNVLC